MENKSVWGLRPEFAKVFVGRESLEDLESSGEVVGAEEVGQVRFELSMCVEEVTLHGDSTDNFIYALDLPVAPGWMATEARGWPLAVCNLWNAPWTTYGKGPTMVESGSFHDTDTKPQTAEDCRLRPRAILSMQSRRDGRRIVRRSSILYVEGW